MLNKIKQIILDLAKVIIAFVVIFTIIYLLRVTVVAYLQSQIENTGTYAVTQVFDGDTIEVDIDGTKEKIRFIGVDTPETGGNNTAVECYGQEATNYTKRMLEGQRVILESDPLSSNRDRYDRLLRYVVRDSDKLNLNKQLLLEGYSAEYSVFPFTKNQEFAAASKQAEELNKGLWANCR